MTEISSLYELFGLSSGCTDDELRRQYRHAMHNHHPDRNPDQVKAATAKTQQLTEAYAALKDYRKYGGEALNLDAGERWTATTGPVKIIFSFRFSGVDIEDIARRKKSFRQAWEAFRQNPSDALQALRLIHAAFNAERSDAVHDLLRNPILIDAASLLLHTVESESASATLVKWANTLHQSQLTREALQILEDAFSTGRATRRVAEELRRMHYGFAQGYTSGAKGKPCPAVRIQHLSRILELGFEYGYIHKLLAEAYHALGNDPRAREHLGRAYEVDPYLSGAVRISRALGFVPAKGPTSPKARKRRKYKYTRLEQIPSPGQIRDWAASGNWSDILAFADSGRCSPRIVPRSRDTLRQIAVSLGECGDIQQAREALAGLLESVYWDVRRASILSLARTGDQHTLHLLQNTLRKWGDRGTVNEAISYLRSRLTNELPSTKGVPCTELTQQAKQAFARNEYGRARFLLENAAATMKEDHPSHCDVIVMLARACAEMGDPRVAVSWIKLVLDRLPNKCRRGVSRDVTSWLWSHLGFEPYDPSSDEDHLLALESHLELALTSSDPDEVLGNLRKLTRWMEVLGQGEIAQWLRSLIRTEAPGTWYVDDHDREQYIRQVELSPELRAQLATVQKRLRSLFRIG